MIRVGIIGSGFGVIGLEPAFRSIRGCTVVGVCEDRTKWRVFLQRDDLDAVAIAVPPDAQYAIAKAGLARGLHVFAEKPLAANVRQAKELLTLARRKKLTHAIDFMFPEIAEWKKVKEMLDKSTVGELVHIGVNWEWLSGDIKYGRRTWKSDVKKGGGLLSFYFSHGLNYLEYFGGRIIDTRTLFTHSRLSKHGGEVGIDMLLRFRNGVTGYAHVSCISRGRISHRLVFTCERGVIVLENSDAIVKNFTIRVYTERAMKKIPVRTEKRGRSEDERVAEVRKLAQRFIDAAAKRRQTSPSFADGVRAQELIEHARATTIGSGAV